MSETRSDWKPRKGLFFNTGMNLQNGPGYDEMTRLEKQIGHVFTNRLYLVQALTHSTHAYEHRQDHLEDNERLEFLGDAVLDLVISDALFRQSQNYDEGYMTKTRALVVCENTLAQIAVEINLGDALKMGRGELATGGREKPSSLANAIEAIFGAIYLDAGYDKVRQIILNLLETPIHLALSGNLVYDFKSRLLELVQSTRGSSILRFQILSERGPVHDPIFIAGVLVDEQLIATGSGSSKKEAEQQAAREALELLQCDRQSCTILQPLPAEQPVWENPDRPSCEEG